MRQPLLLAVLLGLFSLTVQAQVHSDIELEVQTNRIVIDPEGEVEKVSGYALFESEFDNALTPFTTREPGLDGAGFNPGDLLQYRIESGLRKWDAETGAWLDGGFDERLSISGNEASNTVSANTGRFAEGIIDIIEADGGVHRDLAFNLHRTDDGVPDDGAYLVLLSLFGTEADGKTPAYAPSERFWLALHLNAQGTFPENDFETALESLSEGGADSVDPARIEALLNWAEDNFPELFSEAKTTQTVLGFQARCYNNGVCIGVKDGFVYASGSGFGSLWNAGTLKFWLSQAGL
ncbi:MAG: hypothetical protein RQ715_10750 [Methylococcales bacterium]|nr:hypothetical protein [Methylococcales bacterium]